MLLKFPPAVGNRLLLNCWWPPSEGMGNDVSGSFEPPVVVSLLEEDPSSIALAYREERSNEWLVVEKRRELWLRHFTHCNPVAKVMICTGRTMSNKRSLVPRLAVPQGHRGLCTESSIVFSSPLFMKGESGNLRGNTSRVPTRSRFAVVIVA